jgi:hypothetical protein
LLLHNQASKTQILHVPALLASSGGKQHGRKGWHMASRHLRSTKFNTGV